MKPSKIKFVTVIGLICLGSFVPLTEIQAQTTVLDSTVLTRDTSDYGAFFEGSPEAGTNTVEMASGFTTGSAASVLDSITLSLDTDPSGSGFTLALYSDNGDSQPGTLLETLSGSDTPDSGLNTYTSVGTDLAADTSYWWVSSATPSVDGGAFSINQTSDSPGTSPAGWVFNSTLQDNASSGGEMGDYDSGWNNAGTLAQYSINATIDAAPEPSALTLSAMGGLFVLIMYRRPSR